MRGFDRGWSKWRCCSWTNLTLGRTHIAAFRQSDRHLESSLGSAWGASDIKRGPIRRPVPVTKTDVLKDAMCERIVEPQTGLQHPVFQSNAELQTKKDAEMNRRLLAHLTRQLAMRTGLNQTMQSHWNHQQAYGTGQPNEPRHLSGQQQDAETVDSPPTASMGSLSLNYSSPSDDGQSEYSVSLRTTAQSSSSPPVRSHRGRGYSPESVSLYERFISPANDVVDADFWRGPSAQRKHSLISYEDDSSVHRPAIKRYKRQRSVDFRSLRSGSSPNEQLCSPLSTELPWNNNRFSRASHSV